MDTLGYWDAQYIELLRFACKEFPRDARLYKVVADHILYLGNSGIPAPRIVSDISPDAYEGKDQAVKDEAWIAVAAWLQDAPITVSEHRGMRYLAERFAVDEERMRLVGFFFLYDRYALFTELLNSASEFKRTEFLRRFIGMPRNRLIEECRPSGSLVSAGILSNSCHPQLELNRFNVRISLSQYVSYYLDDTHERTLSSFLLDEPAAGSFPLESFDLPQETLAAARAALMRRGPAFILLYGEAGTGKTELGKSLPRSCGKEPFYLHNDKDDGSRPVNSLLLAAKLVDPESETLVVDECDTLLNSAEPNGPKAGPSSFKGMVNQFLDQASCKIIFITNQVNGIPPSVLRRMHLHIGFKPATFRQRIKMWDRIDEKAPLFCAGDRMALSRDYKANPARIRQVYDICSVLRDQGSPQELVLGAAKDMLSRGAEILYGIPRWKECAPESIDPRLLNLSLPADQLLQRLHAWSDTVSEGQGGINLLFYGLPGTGKTAFARHLAQAMGLQPIVKRASDLLSPFVGETEALIRSAFEEAEGAALILDEADSFILDRETATRSWERTRTNEFLTRMEDFRGLFIATTNFTSLLDTASLRRFAFRLEFRSSLPDQRADLARRFFPDAQWEEQSITGVRGLDGVVPGDFKAVSKRLAFSGPLDADTILAELRAETASRNPRSRTIGFGT